MIIPETLGKIATVTASLSELNEDTLSILKKSWPDLRFILCDDDDMPARMPAALRCDQFNLYLVHGGEHCLSLTDDPLHAIGVVVARVEED